MTRPDPRLSPARLAVIDAIRRGHHTVNALASLLGVSDNAVRLQLSGLERDGLIVRRGLIHSGRAGQPAAEYELTPEGEHSLSRAYPRALSVLVAALGKRLDARLTRSVLVDAGRRLATDYTARPSGSLAARAAACVALIESLGGSASVRHSRGSATLQGAGCPLGRAVREEPATCLMMESLLEQHAGLKAEMRCTHGDRPCCRFELRMP